MREIKGLCHCDVNLRKKFTQQKENSERRSLRTKGTLERYE